MDHTPDSMEEIKELHLLSVAEEENFPLLNVELLGPAFLYKFRAIITTYKNSDWMQCLNTCSTLISITWEHLNMGTWKDVDITWRYTYSYCSIYKTLSQYGLIKNGSKTFTLVDCIKTCDMGLLMGAPVLENLLSALASYFHEQLHQNSNVGTVEENVNENPDVLHKKPRLQESSSSATITDNTVSTIKCPSLEYFAANVMSSKTPFILQDCMGFWPCMGERKWTASYIKQLAGKRTVPIELGSKYTEEEWTQKLMTIEEFITEYMDAENPPKTVGYLAQHELFDQIPELQKDIVIPSYCGLGEDPDVNINAWFGPKGTISPLHQDPKHNFLCQVMGEKYVKLYAVDQTQYLYPHDGHLLDNTSQVDVENPDFSCFPEFKNAKGMECILKEGDMLYIPEKCWHYVKSLSQSFSVSFWWK